MNNELYHYYGGELYHAGVKGMKWGKRKAKYEYDSNDPNNQQRKRSKWKTALKVGAGVAVAAGAAYGAKKLYDIKKANNIKKKYIAEKIAKEKLNNAKSEGFRRAALLRQQRNPDTIKRAANVFNKNTRGHTEAGKKIHSDFYNMVANKKAKYKTTRFRDSVNDFYYAVAKKRR